MIRERDQTPEEPEEEVIPAGQCAECRSGSFRLAIRQGIWYRTCTNCNHFIEV